MKTTISSSTGLSEKVTLKKILLFCGILSSLLYAIMMMTIQYEGYSLTSQTVSELSAIGAPTRPLWMLLGFIYAMLMIAFGLGVWLSAGQKRALRVVGGLLLFAYGVLSFVWPFASMHQREVLAAGGGTIADTIHLILGSVHVLSNLLILGFGAAAFGRPFRLYSLATIAVLLVFGVLTGLDSPRISANLPTPWVGIWERIIILAYLLWFVVLTILLLQSGKRQNSINATIAEQKQSRINSRNILRQPAWQRITLLIVLGYEGIGALVGGSLLIVEPDGRLMDLPVEIMHGVFSDFLIPGLILTGLGILNAAAFAAVLCRTQADWLLASLGLGGLTVWFIVEIIILQEFHWLHAMWGLPVLAGCLVTLPLVFFRWSALHSSTVR